MEGYNRELKSRGTTLDLDASLATRLPQRPLPSQNPHSMFEDLGSDFAKRQTRAASASRNAPGASRGTTNTFNDDFSDDEIDFLSGSSRQGSESPRKSKRVRKAFVTAAMPVPVVIDRHQSDPNYRAIDLKKMKIPKKNSNASSTAHTPESSQEPPSKASDAGQSSSRPPPHFRANRRAATSVESETEKLRKKVPLRERSPNQDRSRTRRQSTPFKDEDAVRKESARETDKTPRPSHPLPRPMNKGRSSIGKSQTVPDLGARSSQENEESQSLSRSRSTQDYIHILSSSETDGPKSDLPRRGENSKARGKAKAKTNTDSFRGLSPLSTHIDEQHVGADAGKGKAKSSGKGKGKGKERADPIGTISPLGSPVRSPRRSAPSSFPMPSPLSSPASRRSSSPPRAKHNASSSQQRDVMISSEDDNDDPPQRVLRPFPMETQLLASIYEPSSTVGKRASRDSEEDRGTYRTKRRRDSDKFRLDADSDSDDEFGLDPSVDPSTLCPWCDEPLPSEPTPHLRDLIAVAKRVSRPDDRLANPLGLRAPLAAFVGVCQRHRFERNWIPRARQKGWPTRIEWHNVAGRIARYQPALKAIVDDVDEDFAPEGRGCGSSRRARKENEFWQELVQNVRQHGSRQTAGARGQFLHFTKTQPGYYGELGYVIIHQTLCDQFPPANFHPDATLPLTPSDFIALVLVPEAAVRLIIEDLSLPRDIAIQTLRESVEYGVAMFPADEGEGDPASGSAAGSKGGNLGATEQMFMERARARRKELEEEERREEEEARQAKATAEPKAMPRPRPRGKTPGAQTDVESVWSASSPPCGGSGSKRKSRTSSRSRVTSRNLGPTPGSIVIELSSDTAESEAAGPPKRRTRTRTVKSDVEMDDVGLSATDEATPKAVKVKPRPRPKARSVSVASGREEDSDVQEKAARPPLPSQAMRFVAFDRRGKPQAESQVRLPVDATPRPNPKMRKSDTLSVVPSPARPSGTGSGPAKTPLQIARERCQKESARAPVTSTSRAKTRRDGWLPNLRSGNEVTLDSTTEDDSDAPPQPAASNSSTAKAKAGANSGGNERFRFGEQKERRSWGWLLDDDSQSQSHTPSLSSLE